jgi:glycosyltransferase involved in cell wall biosynthesis
MQKVERSMLAPGITEARVIPNGVDTSVFHPGDRRAARASLGLPPENRLLLTTSIALGRNSWKDFATLRAALRTLAETPSRAPVHVVVLGTEPGEELPEPGVEFRFVGFEPDPAAVAAYYRAADVYVHSTRADTFPLAVLEALASATPVVASSVGGIPEQVEDGVHGFLVPAGDPRGFAAAVDPLLADESLRARQGEAGARLVRQRFDLERQVDAYLDWYAELVDARPQKAAA